MEKNCKACKKAFIARDKKVKYCSCECFKVYLKSNKFIKRLNKVLGIKNEKGNNI